MTVDFTNFMDFLVERAEIYEELQRLRDYFRTVSRSRINPRAPRKVLESTPVGLRKISVLQNAVDYNPDSMMHLPTYKLLPLCGALMEIVQGASWMMTAIPNFSNLTAPLRDLLMENYIMHGTRKQNRLINILIYTCGNEYKDAFQCLITAIKEHATLKTPYPENHLCLY